MIRFEIASMQDVSWSEIAHTATTPPHLKALALDRGAMGSMGSTFWPDALQLPWPVASCAWMASVATTSGSSTLGKRTPARQRAGAVKVCGCFRDHALAILMPSFWISMH